MDKLTGFGTVFYYFFKIWFLPELKEGITFCLQKVTRKISSSYVTNTIWCESETTATRARYRLKKWNQNFTQQLFPESGLPWCFKNTEIENHRKWLFIYFWTHVRHKREQNRIHDTVIQLVGKSKKNEVNNTLCNGCNVSTCSVRFDILESTLQYTVRIACFPCQGSATRNRGHTLSDDQTHDEPFYVTATVGTNGRLWRANWLLSVILSVSKIKSTLLKAKF